MRPVVVLSRDAAIPRLRRALVAPCTTTIRALPSEVILEPGEDPVALRSAVNLDWVESVSVAVLVERMGVLSGARMSEICAALGPKLKRSGLLFVGIDVIGGKWLTEINVTSPTGIVAIDKFNGTDTPGLNWDAIDRRLADLEAA